MEQAHNMNVLQVALGGGNPNQHPDFCRMLHLTRKKYGIVPNYTTNGRGLTRSVLEATKEYCGAVAVSAYFPYVEMQEAIDAFISYGIKVNVHFILSSQSIATAIDWLRNPPSFLSKINALIFLNYKPVGHDHDLLLNKSGQVEYFFKIATEEKHDFKIGFDSCSVTGIASFANVSHVCYEGCDAGRFSMFISEDMRMYPCSFMVEAGYEGTRITGNNLQDFWQNADILKRFRDRSTFNLCNSCQDADVCLCGCLLFPEINLCPNMQGMGSSQKRTNS